MDTSARQDPEPGADQRPAELGQPIGRRVILGMLGLGTAGIVCGSSLQKGLTEVLNGKDGDGGILAGIIPAERFRIYTVAGFPKRTRAGYELAVNGLGVAATTLRFSDLADLPQTQMTKDFQCVTGWRVSDVPWSGVLLRDLLDHVGADPSAAALEFLSFDGVYTESLTMEQARRSDMLIASSMWGKPITTEHGGPVRLYAAPMYGYKSIKWLSEIRVVNEIRPGYWEQLGYDVDAWIGRSNGRNDKPV